LHPQDGVQYWSKALDRQVFRITYLIFFVREKKSLMNTKRQLSLLISPAVIFFISIFLALTVSPGLAQQKVDPSKPLLVVSPFTHETVIAKMPVGWFMANRFRQGDTCAMQFLPAGETADTLTQMVTITTMLDLQQKVNAKEFMQAVIKKMEESKGEAELDLKPISENNPNDVMFEYSVKYPPNKKALFPNQYEVQRIIAGKDGIHTIVYHVRKASISEKERADILQFMRGVHLQSLPIEAPGKSTKGT